jgi:glutathione S-transferase/RNA polymerase-associated protein
LGIFLYDHPFSPYAQKCKIAMHEKGVVFESGLPNAIGSGHADQDFLKANPRAEVPAFVDGDVLLFDSSIIAEYIEDRWPNPPLMPEDPYERARARTLEEVMDTQYEGITWAMGEVGVFRRAEGKKAEELQARARGQLDNFHAWLERQLGDKEWFNGDSFGWADMCIIPFVNGASGFHGPKEGSKLAAWQARANQRPSVQKCQQDIANLQMPMTDVAALVKSGQFKREYRDHRLEWMMRSGGAEIVMDGIRNDTIRFSHEFR